MAGCLDALDELNNEKMDRRPYARTENLNSLVVNLQRMLEEHQDKFVLVFDGIDGQREAPPTLIPALARFGEMVCNYTPIIPTKFLGSTNFPQIPNLSIILITTLPPSPVHKLGVPHLHFPTYTRQELITILGMSPPKIFLTPPDPEQFPDYTADLAAEDDAWLWGRFLTTVWESQAKYTGRDLISFRNTAMRLWRDFVSPIVDGIFGTRDFSRLMVRQRHMFQTDNAVLDRIISAQDDDASSKAAVGTTTPATPSKATSNLATKRKTIQHDLPYYTTHLLISAYLASYNPSRTDTTYFMTHSDKRKNKRKVHAGSGILKSKHRRISRHLLTPSPFSLDRLLAIFRSLLEGSVPQLADIYTQIATLTSMRLLVRVGGAVGSDPLDAGARWRVNFGWEWVRGLGRTVGIEVGEYLVGGVDA